MSPLTPGDSIGPYVIQEELGAGGMGQVFLAHQPPAENLFAVKVIREDLARDPVITRRFLREAQATTRVRHPRLVEVVDSGTADGRLYLAMRHLRGEPLDNVLRARGRLDPPEVHRLVADAASALDALHQADLVHRDVKPSNIMIDADGHATLMDLGLARGADMSVLTRAGGVVGTVTYLAPELIRGSADASPASDIYALGCVAYEAIAGRPPFEGGMFEIGMGHLERPPPELHALRPELPPSLTEAVSLALAKEEGRRPPSATAFAFMLGVSLR